MTKIKRGLDWLILTKNRQKLCWSKTDKNMAKDKESPEVKSRNKC